MQHLELLDKRLLENNLERSSVVIVQNHILTKGNNENKYCIFHYHNAIVEELKYYDSLQDAINVMIRLMERLKDE